MRLRAVLLFVLIAAAPAFSDLGGFSYVPRTAVFAQTATDTPVPTDTPAPTSTPSTITFAQAQHISDGIDTLAVFAMFALPVATASLLALLFLMFGR